MILVIHTTVTGSDMCPIIQSVVKTSAFQHLQVQTQPPRLMMVFLKRTEWFINTIKFMRVDAVGFIFVEFSQVCICSNVGKWHKMDVVPPAHTVVTSFIASTFTFCSFQRISLLISCFKLFFN